jgi:site-specific recombinase XerC
LYLEVVKNPAGKHRNIRARKDLQDWLKRVELPYHSPHKFRHGNAVYSLKHAKDISALKAVSQNLMHANLSVTDGVYGILDEMDVKEKINALAHIAHPATNENNNEIISALKQLLKKLDVN